MEPLDAVMVNVAAATVTAPRHVADGVVGVDGTCARGTVGEPATGLELVAVVEQVGLVVSDDAVSPLTKPE